MRWIENGYHGEMNYMGKNVLLRLNPAQVLPGVQSVIVVSMNYFSGEEHRESLHRPDTGYIASYALNRDYHPVIKERLERLLAFIKGNTGDRVEGRIFVDTGPVMEKAFAVNAGIGWMGKNSLIVNEEGSWFFLGIIFLNIPLEYDTPVEDKCGSCMECIRACPTGALVAPYVLDSRRCISYLLGELKGSIPVELRSLMGNKIFGCDDCQWVCPWNRASRLTSEDTFRPREEFKGPSLAWLLGMDPKRFKGLFSNSPVSRIKRKRFLRNIAVAAGNSYCRDIVPSLLKRSSESDPCVKEHIAWAVEKILTQR